MLLSEVLDYAKSLKNKHINESIESSKITNLFKIFNRSRYTLTPKYIGTNSNASEGLTHTEVVRKMARLYDESGEDSVKFYMNNPNELEKFLNKKYVHDKVYLGPDGWRKVSVIRHLNNILREYAPMGVSYIKDEDIKVIDKKDIRKKEYKDKLTFWIDYSDKPVAISIGSNLVISFYYGKGTNWYEVNHNFSGGNPNIFKKYIYTNEEINEWFRKQFNVIPEIKLKTKKSDIRETLGYVTMKDLVEDTRIKEGWVVTTGQSQDISELIEKRAEYKQCLEKEQNMLYYNKKRYNDIIFKAKNEYTPNLITKTIRNLFDMCMQSMTDVVTIQTDTIETNNIQFMTYATASVNPSIFQVIKDIVGEISIYYGSHYRNKPVQSSAYIYVKDSVILMTIVYAYMKTISDASLKLLEDVKEFNKIRETKQLSTTEYRDYMVKFRSVINQIDMYKYELKSSYQSDVAGYVTYKQSELKTLVSNIVNFSFSEILNKLKI